VLTLCVGHHGRLFAEHFVRNLLGSRLEVLEHLIEHYAKYEQADDNKSHGEREEHNLSRHAKLVVWSPRDGNQADTWKDEHVGGSERSQ